METKPGIKTTEFWVTLAGSLVVLIEGFGGFDLPDATIIGVVAALAAYVLSRGHAKNGVANNP